MSIYYCDWATGNDTTGNGSYSTPWKTIDKATTSRSPGDEIRVAKSPEPIALTGTVTFTLDSTVVNGSGTAFNTELVPGDFIKAPDGQYYEVTSVPSAITAGIYKAYSNATQSGYSSYKLGVTSTGAASNGVAVQNVNSSGNASAYLYISGGWDLSTQTQTGQTYFKQMHTTFANRIGYGLYIVSKSYTNISRLHFLRYSSGIYYYNSNNNTCTSLVCSSNGGSGIYYYNSYNNTSTSPVCISNNNSGIWYASSSRNICTSPICSSNSGSGILYSHSSSNTCISPTCNSNYIAGILYTSSSSNTCISPTCNSNYLQGGIGYGGFVVTSNIIYGTLSTSDNDSGAIYHVNSGGHNYIAKANLAESAKTGGYFYSYENSRVYINDMNGYSYIYTDNGNIVSQDATAGGTGKEWKLSPTDAIRDSYYPLDLPIARFAVASTGQVTVTVYFKKSSTGVAGALRCRYGQVAWSDASEDKIVNCPDNTNRNQVTLQFTPTEAGVVEIEALAWYVSSTTDSVIIDDIAISQV